MKREKGKIQLEVWVCCPDFEQENEQPEENVKVAQGHPWPASICRRAQGF